MTNNRTPFVDARRRRLLGGLGLGLGFAAAGRAAPTDTAYPADKADAIVQRIRAPQIPRRDFLVKDLGTVARALDACARAGGGRVVLPKGTTLTGPIRLHSNMELHVPEGARLKFIPDPARYLPPVLTRWEGVELMGYHPLIYAFEAHDIAVTGGGILDGSADEATWWPWKGAGRYRNAPANETQARDRERLFAMAEQGVPVERRVFGEGSRLRPSFFQPYRCTNVLVEGVTVSAAPFWLMHPVECTSVTFRGVTCSSHGHNNDGIDPESCTDVLIDGCTFDTGDDCIAIKSGRNADGRRIGKPCAHVVIRNCHMADGHAGVAIGSEMSGGVHDVYVQDCTMDSPSLTRAIVLKSNSYRGGRMQDIHVTRIKAGRVDKAFLQIWLQYEEGDGGPYVPVVERVTVTDSTARRADRMLVVRGRPDSPVRELVLRNVTIEQEEKPSVVVDAKNVVVERVSVNGKPWTRADLDRLPGLASITCDKWAVCR
jgi:polygalacturonase